MSGALHTPVRTCVGCRRAVPQEALVRVVVDDAGVVAMDEGRRLPGRGAWVHRTAACVHNAARGGLARSLRRKVDPTALVNWASKKPGSSDLGGVESSLATASEKS